MVRWQTVISETTGHQNNLACAGVVGLQMFFFFYLLFSSIFQIKEYVLLLRPKKGKVIYKRKPTLASQCQQHTSVSRQVNFSGLMSFYVLHYNLQSKCKCHSIPMPDLGLNIHPSLISEGPRSPMSMKLSPARSDFPQAAPLPSPLPGRATQDCNHSLKM